MTLEQIACVAELKESEYFTVDGRRWTGFRPIVRQESKTRLGWGKGGGEKGKRETRRDLLVTKKIAGLGTS